MSKKLSKRQLDKLELEEYRELQKHPAMELIRYLPHTKQYKILVLLEEVLNETFDSGYECGVSDSKILMRRNLERCFDE